MDLFATQNRRQGLVAAHTIASGVGHQSLVRLFLSTKLGSIVEQAVGRQHCVKSIERHKDHRMRVIGQAQRCPDQVGQGSIGSETSDLDDSQWACPNTDFVGLFQ